MLYAQMKYLLNAVLTVMYACTDKYRNPKYISLHKVKYLFIIPLQRNCLDLLVSLKYGESGQNAVRHAELAGDPGVESVFWMKMASTWIVLENSYRLRIAPSENVQVCICLKYVCYVQV